jgi:hypothetical protein
MALRLNFWRLRVQDGPRPPAFKHCDLLSEGQDLKGGITPTAKENSERGKESEDGLEHELAQPYSLTRRNL